MTAEEVWHHLVRILEQMSGARGDSFADQDQALAAGVRANPGALEERILSHSDDLAARGCADRSYPSLLGYFWNLCPPGDPLAAQHPTIFRGLPATFAAMNATPMLRAYAATRQRAPQLGPMAHNNSVRIARYFLERAGLAALDELVLPTEHRDFLRALVTSTPLPDVLPVDLTSWSPGQIAGTLADYAGISIADLEARLRPGSCSSSGFLAPGESLGEVIHRDAVALARIYVTRHELVDRIDLALDCAWHAMTKNPRTTTGGKTTEPQHVREQRLRARLGPPRADGTFALPLTCNLMVFAGHQQDPFHSTDTYGLRHAHGDSRGACDFAIANPARGSGAILRGPDLITVLIRRYGFFEGAVASRVDPVRAAWVLGVADAELGWAVT